MTEIPLTRGMVAIVDDQDYDWLSQRTWYSNAQGASRFYAVRHLKRENGKQVKILMHRVIWEHYHGQIPDGMEIDHINGNSLDNRLDNLRVSSHSCNIANSRKRAAHTSSYKGVYWLKKNKKWRATIQYSQRKLHIGLFDSELEAAVAYDARAKELFGHFALLNFKEGQPRE